MTTHTAPDALLAQTELTYAKEREKIAVGIGTVTGLLAGLASALVPLISWIGDLGMGWEQQRWFIVASGALFFTTQIGRYGQAIAGIVKNGPGGDVAVIPPDLGDAAANVGPDGGALV